MFDDRRRSRFFSIVGRALGGGGPIRRWSRCKDCLVASCGGLGFPAARRSGLDRAGNPCDGDGSRRVVLIPRPCA